MSSRVDIVKLLLNKFDATEDLIGMLMVSSIHSS